MGIYNVILSYCEVTDIMNNMIRHAFILVCGIYNVILSYCEVTDIMNNMIRYAFILVCGDI